MTTEKVPCPGPMSRRGFLQVGSVGVGGLGLADFLKRRANADEATGKSTDTAVILCWLYGGFPHTESYDMKPSAPLEYRGVFEPISTNVPGLDVCELLPRHTKIADRFSVIRSVSHFHNQHGGGAQQMLTARPPLRADGDAQNYYPAVGSVVSKMRERRAVGVPNYMLISNEHAPVHEHAGAYLGAAHTPFNVGANFLQPEFKVQNLTMTKEVESQLENRVALLREFDEFRRDIDSTGDMLGMDAFNQLAISMLTSDKARNAFDLTRESDHVRNRYGRHAWGQRALLARRLVQAGSSFVTIDMSNPQPGVTNPPDTRAGDWDTHSVSCNHFTDCRWKMPYYDQAITALIEDIYEQGMDKKVMVIAMGEFGRTPLIEYGTPGRPGRGHHCNSMSILVSGGGMRMGQVIGATDDKADHPVDRPLRPTDLWATAYRFLGIDYEYNLTDNIGRPMPILPSGEPIRELLST